MDKMIKDGYSAEDVKISKKGNMMYWDEIDEISEKYVKQIMKYSVKKIQIPYLMTKADVVLEVGKEVTECIVKYLEENYGAEFPVVDENY